MAIDDFVSGLGLLLGSLTLPMSAIYLALSLRRRATAVPVLRRLD